MKSFEIVELIKAAKPNLLGEIPDKKAAQIISAGLAQLKLQLETTGKGPVKVPSLGTFRVKQVEREKDGKKVTVERIGFKVAKAKVKGEGKAKKAE